MSIDEQELAAAESELSKIYLDIAERYKQMSRVKDAYRLNIMQEGVNQRVNEAKLVIDRGELLRRNFIAEWDKKRREL